MRYHLSLSIRYAFDRPTGMARQVLRICPADLPGVQQVSSCRVMVLPAPAARREFTDFFGTRAIELALPGGLTELRFDMTAEVTRLDTGPEADLSVPLPGLAADLAAETGLGPMSPHHFLAPSPRIPPVPEIAQFAAAAVAGAPTTRAAVRALGEALHRTLRFDPQATEVDTPIDAAFAGRQGVCQDFSQIMVAGLRSLGIPAAYVSGFLRTLPPPGQPRRVGADAMHAWVRAWTGASGGWCDYDPTNACFAGADHVVIGHGRDYSDAAPIIGMLRLDGAQTSSHSVDLVEI
ncbi:transglutaminase family protein [Pseudogemmobacter blasticus]|uniref:Transglutaminase n=1 Tax=Fuscovulum blasticum DSM 2131 TaxID=1188250 RepID=A0A2T4JBH7_FUSBL|nr:transglutaminase family protein [Fuscovulum blasticum]PTE15270.1 transglutaminase [Fuscovulum blasticum DSM 2131]